MVFLQIDTKNYDKKNNKTKKTPIEELNDAITHNKPIFILIYMEGCGPCNSTRPEWSKIKNVMKESKDNNNIFIVDIDRELIDKVKTKSPRGFPTMRYIKGKTEEDFEDSTVQNKDREVDNFIEWIELKTGEQKGGTNTKTRRNKKTLKNRKTKSRKNKKCVKWSLKYKRSINCRRPKGFSQRQHCKYGRH
jgi:thiol-disulfide isomerase/thioredoxin